MIKHVGDYSLCCSGFNAVPLGNTQTAGPGIINAWHGFRVFNTAPSGKFLRGNGNYYVEGTIEAGDLPAHTHAISDTTGLQAALDGKSNVGHTHAAADITSGVLAMARLATGTPDGTKFVRDDGTLAVPPGAGVTSVALSMPAQFSVSGTPITGTGTFGVTWATQTANIVFAGPTSGGAAVPTFRALVAADLPAHTHANTDISGLGTASTHNVPASGNAASGEVVKGSDTRLTDARTPTSHTHAAADITSGVLAMARLATGTPDGTKFVRDDGVLAVPPSSSGTVTSFSSGNLSPLFTTNVATATTTPALTYTLTTQPANKVFAGPTSGGDAAPTFRSLVSGDLPSHTHAAADITSGTIATARLGSGSASSTTFLRGDQTYAVPEGAVTNSIGQSGFNGASDDFNDLDSTYRLVYFGDTNMQIEVPGAGTFRIEAHVQFGGNTSSADNLEAKFNGVTDSERATSINSNGWAQIILCAYVTQASTTTYQVYAKTLSTSTNWGSRYGSWIAYAKQY